MAIVKSSKLMVQSPYSASCMTVRVFQECNGPQRTPTIQALNTLHLLWHQTPTSLGFKLISLLLGFGVPSNLISTVWV
jgi:hypothetical protein